jgi:hypothetical protein
MVPTTQYSETAPNRAKHESINDLPHHNLTAPQIFYPTSESRAFNRTDAGRVFSAAPRLPDSQDVGQGGTPLNEPWADTDVEIAGKRGHEAPVLKPSDARIPHPHLIKHEQDKLDPRYSENGRELHSRYEARLQQDREAREQLFAKRARKAEARKTRAMLRRASACAMVCPARTGREPRSRFRPRWKCKIVVGGDVVLQGFCWRVQHVSPALLERFIVLVRYATAQLISPSPMSLNGVRYLNTLVYYIALQKTIDRTCPYRRGWLQVTLVYSFSLEEFNSRSFRMLITVVATSYHHLYLFLA